MKKDLNISEETKKRVIQIIENDENTSFSNIFSNEIEQLTPQFYDSIYNKIQTKNNVIISNFDFKLYKTFVKFVYAGSIAASIIFGIYISHNFIDINHGFLGKFHKIEKYSYNHKDNDTKIIINYF